MKKKRFEVEDEEEIYVSLDKHEFSEDEIYDESESFEEENLKEKEETKHKKKEEKNLLNKKDKDTAKKLILNKENKKKAANKKQLETLIANKYDPLKGASWEKGKDVPYSVLAKTFKEIDSISSRLKIIELLTNLFRSIIVMTPKDLLPAIYLCINKLGPQFEGVELGIGESLILKSVAESCGRKLETLKTTYSELGDL